MAGLDEDYSIGNGTAGHHAGGSGNAAGTAGEAASGGSGATSSGSGLTGGSGATGGGGTGATGGGGAGGGGCATDYVCVPDPAGGDLVRRRGGGGGCPSGWNDPTPLYAGTDPGCSACGTCSQPSGGSCGNTATVTRYDDSSCTTVADGPTTVSIDSCRDVGASGQPDGYRVVIDVANEGTCSVSDATALPMSFATVCALEGSPQGSCESGGVCVPEVAGSPDGACVLLGGKVTCPPDYPSRSEHYASFVDNRTCSCNCTAATGGRCGGTLQLWSSDDCGGTIQASLTITSCINTQPYNTHDSYKVQAGSLQPGSCQTQSDPGTVDFGDPVTLCCELSVQQQ